MENSSQKMQVKSKKTNAFLFNFQLSTFSSRASRGFTLIELLVSVALFSVVMLVCVGALLSLVGANRKAQALESVMNNLNISLDDMVRGIREGSYYDCGNAAIPNLTTGNADCSGGNTSFSYAPYGADTTKQNKRTVYALVTGTSGGYIERSEDGGATYSQLTAPEVNITDMEFYVIGTQTGDTTQPRVIIIIKGTAGGGQVKVATTFHIQATAVQRVLDL